MCQSISPQRFVKSAKYVTFSIGLTENDVYIRIGSKDGTKKYPFLKIPSALWKRSREGHVIISKRASYSRVKGMYS